MKTVQELAEESLKYLKWGKRTKEAGGEDYCFTKDEAPQWFKDLVYKAHKIDDVLPNDYIYCFISDALSLIAGSDEPEEAILEIEGDIYNHDLLKWLSNNLTFSCYVDEVIQEYGTNEDTQFFNILMDAQKRHKEVIARSVLESLHLKLCYPMSLKGIK